MTVIPAQLIPAGIHVTLQGISYCSGSAGSSTESPIDTEFFPPEIWFPTDISQAVSGSKILS